VAVLKGLAGPPFEEFRKSGLTAEQARRLLTKPEGALHPEHKPLRAALRNWAARWGLDAPWCLDVAVDTLSMWRDHDELVRSLPEELPEDLEVLLTWRDWEDHRHSPRKRKPFDPKKNPPTWAHSIFLDKESRALMEEQLIWDIPFDWLPPFFAHLEVSLVYQERARRVLLRHIRVNPFTARLSPQTRRAITAESLGQIARYCERVIRFYRTQKDEDGAPRWKKVVSSPDLERELRWLVEKQVMGRSGIQIAVLEGVDTSTVNKAVNKLRRLLDLPARKSSRNRRAVR
jgi:hypothetical protein